MADGEREQMIEFFTNIDEVFVTLAGRAARVTLAGELNELQRDHVRFMLVCIDTLRSLVRAEATRTGCREAEKAQAAS